MSKCPILIIHGLLDDVVPSWNGKELFLSIPQEYRYQPFWIPDAGHNDVERKSGERYFEHIQKFISDITLNNNNNMT